jgi:acyl-CoA synthetase (AMP-forming)/AMP-acid ligase II
VLTSRSLAPCASIPEETDEARPGPVATTDQPSGMEWGIPVSHAVTFIDLVRDRAAAIGDQDAHIALSDSPGGMRADRTSYAGLDHEARRIASLLQDHGAGRQPVLLLFPESQNFLRAFMACMYAGAIAVPAPMPDGPAQGRRPSRTAAIIRDAQVRLLLTDSANAPEIARWLATAGLREVVCLAVDTPGLGDADAWQMPGSRGDDLAFLQYTSGSVSAPRGVMVSHANLMANQAALQRVFESTAEDRFGGWLPHFHDMGLIAHLLHPLYLGSASVQMTPTSFIKRPVRWLQAIGEHRVTVGGGPNFGYDLCLRRISDEQLAGLDLSGWRLALNGAEPVRSDTLRAFTERFAAAGLRPQTMYPCYGLAEATLVVSGGRPGAGYTEMRADKAELERDRLVPAAPEAAARMVVSSGRVLDFDARVVDPIAYRELPPGAVGEIWLRGPSVAKGYWRRPSDSSATFGAALDSGEVGFLRTGDLGVIQDGELYVTGRLKEVVILNGRNVYPQDIEWAVRGTHKALTGALGAVFSVEADREQLVVVQEVRGGDLDQATLRRIACGIQSMVGKDFNMPAGNVLLVRPGTVRRTSSGKVQRTMMRTLFLDGALRGEYEVMDPAVRAMVRADDSRLGHDLLLGGGPGQPW